MALTTWLRWCVVGWCLAAVPAWAADISAHVDRSTVQLDESFQLVINVEGSADGDPDFTPLEKDFEILSRSQNTSMQIINMSISRRTTWNLTLMAKTTGTLVIPAISFGKDHSPVTWVTVQAAPMAQPGKAGGDIFIEVEAKPEQSTVQAQILYTVRLYRAVNMVEASLSEPKVSGMDAVVTKLGDDKSYETRRDNRRYVVTERRYAIFPQKSGAMVLEPVVFEGRYVDGYNSLRSKRLRSDAIALDVQPVPAAAAGKPWLPAANVTLSEQWPQDPPKFSVGEPVTRNLILQAEGLTAAQLPALSTTPPDGLKTYEEQPQLEDKPTDNGMVGTRSENVAFVATRAGTYTLPAIAVSWWNINSQQLETARIPERKIKVMPAAGSVTTQQKMEAESEPITAHGLAAAPGGSGAGVWPWIAGVTTLGWLLTLLAWWRTRRAPPFSAKPVPVSKPVNTASAALKRLATSCRDNNAEDAKAALLIWAQQRWPEDPATNLGQIAHRLGGDAEQQIQRLNEFLYGATQHQAWAGEGLYQAIQANKFDSLQKSTTGTVVLPPLY